MQITECIGTEATSTVYAGEACGIKLALEGLLRLKRDREIKNPVIFSDSQATLKILINPPMVSGQVYIHDCVRFLRDCMDEGINVTLRWIPGQEGVPGNEAADRAAKKAAIQGPPAWDCPRGCFNSNSGLDFTWSSSTAPYSTVSKGSMEETMGQAKGWEAYQKTEHSPFQTYTPVLDLSAQSYVVNPDSASYGTNRIGALFTAYQ